MHRMDIKAAVARAIVVWRERYMRTGDERALVHWEGASEDWFAISGRRHPMGR